MDYSYCCLLVWLIFMIKLEIWFFQNLICLIYVCPCSWLTHKYRQLYVKPISNSRVHMEERTQDPCKDEWLWNYQLNEVNIFSLFDEFLEMSKLRREGLGQC